MTGENLESFAQEKTGTPWRAIGWIVVQRLDLAMLITKGSELFSNLLSRDRVLRGM